MDNSNNDLITTRRIEDEIPRNNKYINSCGFTEEQLQRRGNDLKQLVKLYPNTCISMLELAWSFHEFTPKEEIDDIIKNDKFSKPKARQMGGIIKDAINIESAES